MSTKKNKKTRKISADDITSLCDKNRETMGEMKAFKVACRRLNLTLEAAWEILGAGANSCVEDE